MDTTVETYEQWAARGQTLIAERNRNMWLLGDWLNEGEQRYGETYAQAHDETLISYGTLVDYAYVARGYPTAEDRAYQDKLSFSHHKVALGISAQTVRFQALAHAYKWQFNRDEFREYVRWLKDEPINEPDTTATAPPPQYVGSVTKRNNNEITIVLDDAGLVLETGQRVIVTFQ